MDANAVFNLLAAIVAFATSLVQAWILRKSK